MSCCGNKRAEWNRQQKAAAWNPERGPATETAPIKILSPKIFEYIGTTGLVLTGAASQQVYRFSAPGDRIEVAAEDAFALMGEPDLRAVKQQAGAG